MVTKFDYLEEALRKGGFFPEQAGHNSGATYSARIKSVAQTIGLTNGGIDPGNNSYWHHQEEPVIWTQFSNENPAYRRVPRYIGRDLELPTFQKELLDKLRKNGYEVQVNGRNYGPNADSAIIAYRQGNFEGMIRADGLVVIPLSALHLQKPREVIDEVVYTLFGDQAMKKTRQDVSGKKNGRMHWPKR
ncbi:MAG: hypothetical protein HY364_05205 [Candidatus Aenigmarchaeota archaeon]|nr:hypothetical protein [Candidatus Aenigmarchaeota archaeon]